MIHETYNLWTKAEYTYPVLGEFIPNITTYIHEEDDKKRPAMIVVPGGGYRMVSSSEGEIVAKEFYNKGYNSFVLTYTVNLTDLALKLQPLKDLSKAIVLIRDRNEQFRVDTDKLVICGFSAGGHLCGSLAVHYDAQGLIFNGKYQGISNRPNAVILSYPVISSGDFIHRDSFLSLLGEDATTEELEYMSLEKHVTKNTPPVFLWHTATDDLVPVENSYLFSNACKENNVPFEIHIFDNGKHGMSLANDEWASRNYGGEYTMQQFYETMQTRIDHNKELPPPFDTMVKSLPKGMKFKDMYLQVVRKYKGQLEPDEKIAIWPELVHNWLKRILGL